MVQNQDLYTVIRYSDKDATSYGYEMPFNPFFCWLVCEASFGVLPDLPNFKGMGNPWVAMG